MKERPMLMSAPMVRAILAGTKTQTRRVVKLPADAKHVRYWAPPSGHSESGYADPGVNYWTPDPGGETESNHLDPCPYGQPGDRLWVREAWRVIDLADVFAPREITAAHRIWFEADGPHEPPAGRYRPGMFMPRWASRILLEVTAVRVEQLQEISEADAIAEGVTPIWPDGPRDDGGPNHFTVDADPGHLNGPTAATVYRMLWELINGEGSWDANPWVWVVEFKRVTP